MPLNGTIFTAQSCDTEPPSVYAWQDGDDLKASLERLAEVLDQMVVAHGPSGVTSRHAEWRLAIRLEHGDKWAGPDGEGTE